MEDRGSNSEGTKEVPKNDRLIETYRAELHDLGDHGFPDFQGIYSPIYSAEYIDKFIHKQFLEGADKYAKDYEKFSFFEQLLRRAIGLSGGVSETSDTISILDIGSGAGNSIIPLLDIFPTAEIIASDLSPQLLAILREHLSRRDALHRCSLLQLNAEEMDFHENSFDYVVGVAILHHLFHPEKAIESSSNILRPGGVAIFIEPFENGNYILRMAYSAILNHKRARKLDADVAKFMLDRIMVCDGRRGIDKSDPKFLTFDDKWNFTNTYFERLAEQNGFSKYRYFPIGHNVTPFEGKVRVHLRGKGTGKDPLPEWAWDIIREYDANTSEELRNDLPIEAVVMLTK